MVSRGRIPRCPKCLRVFSRGDWRKLYPTTDVLWRLCPSCDPNGIRRDEAATRVKAAQGYGPAPKGADPFAGFREG